MDRPGIGTAIFIRKGNSVLMSYRKNSGLLALPGGHFERFEQFDESAVREVKEETDLDIDVKQMKLITIENVVIKAKNCHFLDIVFKTDFPENQIIKNTEPHNHTDWEWIDAENFEMHYQSNKLFCSLSLMRSRFENSQQFFDYIFK